MMDDIKKKDEYFYLVMSPAQFNQAVTPISPVLICFNSFLGRFKLNLSSLWRLSLSFPTQTKISNPSRFLVWTSPLTLSSLLSISPPSKIPSNPASPDETSASPLLSTSNPTNVIPDAASSTSTGLQFSISLPKTDQSKTTDKLPPFHSLLPDVRPLLSRPNHLKLQPDHSALGHQHRREFYTSHVRRTKRPRFNQHLQYCLKPEFCKWEIIYWDSKRQEYTIQSTSLPSQRLVVPPQEITALPRWCRWTLSHQPSSLIVNLPLTHLFRCATLLMSLPLAQLFCGMPPQIIPSHAPSINQHITDGTILLPLPPPTNQSKPDATAHQSTPGSSALLSSPLQHKAKCLQAIHKTIQQLNQHLKAEHLDKQALQLIVLQLQNDFALLRFLLFSDKGYCRYKTSPLINSNPNPSSSAFLLPCPDDPKLRHSTPVGAVLGPPRAKNNPANADFQPTTNTHEAPSITLQNLTSTICKLEKLFTDEIATYTSITAGIHSQYFFLYDKIRQFEPGNSDAIIWKIPQ